MTQLMALASSLYSTFPLSLLTLF